MGNAKEEKFLVLLNLINDCRNKFRSLYDLSFSTLQTAKEEKAELGRLHDEIMSIYDELKLIERSGKSSKLMVKSIKNRLEQTKGEYSSKYEDFVGLFNECIALYKQYKQEVQMCCDTYKKMKSGEELETVEKGYRQQVTIIQAIRGKTKENISKHKDWVEVERTRKNSLENIYNKAQVIVSSL